MKTLAPALWMLLLAASPAGGATSATPAPAAATASEAANDEADAPTPVRRSASARSSLRLGVDDVLLELAALPDAPQAQRTGAVRATPFLSWQASRAWEWRASARLEGSDQAGGSANYGRWRAEAGDTYVRYRSGDTRLTLGAQTIVWGRADEVPVIDRVSRADLTRFVLDKLAERRLAQTALRWEQNLGELKLDAVWLPAFQGAALPEERSVFSPLNRGTGQALGRELGPAEAAFVRAARWQQDDGGAGGGALRLTSTGAGGADWGLTLARTRQSVPYYVADPTALTLTATHPYVRFAGVDGELVTDGATWRMELGWSDGVPYTAQDGSLLPRQVVEAVGAVEFFPGGGDTRVNLQLAWRGAQGSAALQELKDYAALNGEVQTELAQGRWRASLRFNLGLNVHDVYLAPRLSYLGWEPHELYVAAHYFDGEVRTLGGFHRRHGLVALGLKTRF